MGKPNKIVRISMPAKSLIFMGAITADMLLLLFGVFSAFQEILSLIANLFGGAVTFGLSLIVTGSLGIALKFVGMLGAAIVSLAWTVVLTIWLLAVGAYGAGRLKWRIAMFGVQMSAFIVSGVPILGGLLSALITFSNTVVLYFFLKELAHDVKKFDEEAKEALKQSIMKSEAV